MKIDIYSEHTNQLLFTVFDSKKEHKTNLFRTHLHPDLEIGFICEGNGKYILDHKEYRASVGDAFLVCPNKEHCVPTIFSTYLKSINIHITPYYIWNFCSEYIDLQSANILLGKIAPDPFCYKFSNCSHIFSEISNLCKDYKSFENRFQLRYLVLKLLVSLASEFPKTDCKDNLSKNILSYQEDIQNAIFFINNNLCKKITLDDIAKSVGYSRSHFSAVFKEITGIPPYEYLILQRIEQAVCMLKNSNMNITEISQACGFCNLSNFNKVFLKITGVTPRDYRTLKNSNN